MPPLRPACDVVAAAYKAYASVLQTLEDIKDLVTDVITLRDGIRFGFGVLDAVSAELVSAIGAAANQIAETIAGSISKVASNYLEQFMNLILKVVLAAPSSVFSLVNIPHEQAIKAGEKEGLYLEKAHNNIHNILRIILKWVGLRSGKDYYDQMQEALPHISNAIISAGNVIADLEGDSAVGNDERDSTFNEVEYNKMRGYLNLAVEATRSKSKLYEEFQVAKRKEIENSEKFRIESEKINEEFNASKKALSTWYRESYEKLRGNSNSLTERASFNVKEQALKTDYGRRLNRITSRRDLKLTNAKTKIEAETLVNSSLWVKAASGVAGQFDYDIGILGNELQALLENIKKASIKNKECQLYCNNIYNIKDIVRTLIRTIISYLRKGSNAAGSALASVIEGSQTLMEIVETDFLDASDRYEKPDKDISASELSITLTAGHTLLIGADSTLEAAVSDSLKNLINSDDLLVSENVELSTFIGKLYQIPDWDGKIGVWSTDIQNASLSPYIQMIADATTTLVKVPALSMTNRDKDRDRVKKIIRDIDSNFNKVKKHNRLVLNTLYEYTPFASSEAGDLKKLLDRAGLLQSFALVMSITTVVTELMVNYDTAFGDEWPTFSSCKDAYPDSFSDPDIAAAAAINERDVPSEKLNLDKQAAVEKSSNDNISLKKEITTADFFKHDETYNELQNNERNPQDYANENRFYNY